MTIGPTTPELFQRNIPLEIEKHAFGEHRKASMARVAFTVETEAEQPDKGRLSLRKRIIDSPEANAVRKCDTDFLYELTGQIGTRWRPGFFLVPIGLVGRADDRAMAWLQERSQLADAAAAKLPDYIAEAQQKLGTLFVGRDYPTVEQYRRSFSASYRFVDVGVPNLLREVRADVFTREQAKLEADAREAADLIQQHLRRTLLDITTHLRDLLTPKEDGKHKALRAGALDDLFGFLDTVQLRMTNDADLAPLVARLRGMQSSLDLDVLRHSDASRERIQQTMGEMTEALTPLVSEQVRGIRFRDDEAA